MTATIRFSASKELQTFADLEAHGQLYAVPFQVRTARGTWRMPQGLSNLADLKAWMKAKQCKIVAETIHTDAMFMGRDRYVTAEIVPADDPRQPKAARPIDPAKNATPCPEFHNGEPVQSIHQALWDAFATGALTTFCLTMHAFNGWVLTLHFCDHAAARQFAVNQANRRPVTVKLEAFDDYFAVQVPVFLKHARHQSAITRWACSCLTETEFRNLLATANLTHV